MSQALQRAERHLQAGRRAVQSQAWGQACTEFEHAARLQPAIPSLWLSLAGARVRAGQAEAA